MAEDAGKAAKDRVAESVRHALLLVGPVENAAVREDPVSSRPDVVVELPAR